MQKIDLSHPLARATCLMVLRPLAAFTRPWVVQRMKKIAVKEKSGSIDMSSTVVDDNNMETNIIPPQTSADDSISPNNPVSTPENITVFADASEPFERSRSNSGIEDINMVGDDSDGNSSGTSSGNEGEDDNDDDDDDDDDDAEDDEEEEEDEEDEDEDDDEEMSREDIAELMQAEIPRRSRRRVGGRLWDSLDAELSVLDGLEDVEDEDLSYLTMLDEGGIRGTSRHPIGSSPHSRRRGHRTSREGRVIDAFANEARSILDLFSNSFGSHEPGNITWSNIFREFDSHADRIDTDSHRTRDIMLSPGQDSMFVLRDFDEFSDNEDQDVFHQDGHRFRSKYTLLVNEPLFLIKLC